ncbi:MAG: 1-deoxy-D-xylulose-5-phosphate reductoisomerase [Actinomycetota bacterium]|nr:1-deoxy-D-xylulose-5-phosphate reductoisomerase [Actinomycetota bacterium]
MTRVSLVGSTGSVGRQALDVVKASQERLEVVALGAGSDIVALAAQAVAVRPQAVAVADATRAPELAATLKRSVPGCEVLAGPEGLAVVARMGDVVLNAVVGFAGLPVTLAALSAGRRLALANKESLIAAAPLVQRARATPGAMIVPVDSEHCAIHQCLGCLAGEEQPGERSPGPAVTGSTHGGALAARSHSAMVRRLVLTASGGPFRGRSAEELGAVTVEDALAHPTWSMGPKITVDSSTLMNKGLEVIEAHELFGVDYDRIEVVVHPQSVVHSMVEMTDGATLAQLSMPDMRLPIGYALMWPDRLAVAFGAVDWAHLGRLDFEDVDRALFRCLDLAYGAGREGKSAPAWLNAANEVAVAAFLAGRIPWTGIADVVEEVLTISAPTPLETLDDVLDADRRAREVAAEAAARLGQAA